MHSRSFTRGFAILIAVVAAWTCFAAVDGLERDFKSPPDATKPRCYWYWMDGHITKAGITKDLEAMKRFGIGEGYIGIISGQSGLPAEPDAPEALSDEWWSFVEHAIREGSRLGVDVGFFNSPGWSQSGGPWVQPNQAMRYVTLPELHLTGPQQFEGAMPKPEGPFQDIAVLAFPAPEGEGEFAIETARTAKSIDFVMEEPFTARSLTVHPVKKVNVTAELQVSEDGNEFRTIKAFAIDRHNLEINVGPVPLAPIVVSFPATTARFFRLTFSEDCELGEIHLSPAARVESIAEKSMIKMFQDPLPPFDFYTWPQQAEPEAEFAIDAGAVIDLTDQLVSDGTFRWDVPEGDWIVVRSAMTPTGTKNSPSPPEATGLEVDKMNREHLKVHFDSYVGDLLNRIPADERTAWKHVVADSYEMGPQNWTDGFAEDFEDRYGYDPMLWMPVLTGRIVSSADQSNRFLWDLRRMVADRVARDYVGGLRDLCNEHGLKMWLENYGHWGFPGEFLNYGGFCDEISGEFWVTGTLGSIELRDAASAAHIYDKPIVWAEAFTGGPAFVNTPRDFKARCDWAFSEGINQYVLHVMIHQPWEDRKPGINAPWGTEFNRHNTWFDLAQPWVEYLRRCSVMLQAGTPVADIAYFIGEDAPKMAGICDPPLPAGYDFDYINADVIENKLKVSDGRFVLPNGVSYALLVLPQSETMRPELLQRIQKLVGDGGAVLGPKPNRSPSMEGYPACDDTVRKLADSLWDSGRVQTGTDLSSVLTGLDVTPDVVCPEDVLWKHRRDGDSDIYFVSNQRYEARTVDVSFRAMGTPELWRADSGQIELIPYKVRDGRTSLTLDFEPAGSVFLVFGRNTQGIQEPQPELPVVATVEGPWQVEFPSQTVTFDALKSWTESADPEIKFYSGTATYRTTFTLSEDPSSATLDLGVVDEMARVRVNEQEVGTLWKPPYTVDISEAIKPGENTLEVDVVNVWLNRLIGDAQPGVENPQTFTTTKSWKADTPLQSSGLLGPVVVRGVD